MVHLIAERRVRSPGNEKAANRSQGSDPDLEAREAEAVPIALAALRGAADPNSKPSRQERLTEPALS